MKNFKQWLLQLNSDEAYWNSATSFEELEEKVIENIRDTGYVNLRTIFENFYLNDDPNVPFRLYPADFIRQTSKISHKKHLRT